MSNNDLPCNKCKGHHHPVECPMEEDRNSSPTPSAEDRERLEEFFKEYVSHCGYTLKGCKGCQEEIATALIQAGLGFRTQDEDLHRGSDKFIPTPLNEEIVEKFKEEFCQISQMFSKQRDRKIYLNTIIDMIFFLRQYTKQKDVAKLNDYNGDSVTPGKGRDKCGKN